MNCIVIDDEPLAREAIQDLIEGQKNLTFIGSFNNAIKAEKFMTENEVDLIFLDIEMPRINGLEFAKKISKNTMVIFTTAHKEYALESYNLDAIDYLLKPVLPARFEKAIEKAFAFYKLLKSENGIVEKLTQNFIFIKAERKYYKILFEKILYIEALKDYVIIHTFRDKVITAMNLKTIHSKLPKDIFIRVSKSYIVNESAIECFDNNTIYINENEIPIGKVYQENFYNQYLNEPL
ncbi:LytTR family DNA-binding domain-containing protein [Galbibacter orientalis]|jgi:DNA-binding LytR/AlgR family response regulator|uniref:LytR/AlgR family response regulator transcription factor n=1 Tax=Galbibacter orientalis TaxID=453852 RepID=UPI0030808CCB